VLYYPEAFLTPLSLGTYPQYEQGDCDALEIGIKLPRALRKGLRNAFN
jgi:hypothetical protein